MADFAAHVLERIRGKSVVSPGYGHGRGSKIKCKIWYYGLYCFSLHIERKAPFPEAQGVLGIRSLSSGGPQVKMALQQRSRANG